MPFMDEDCILKISHGSLKKIKSQRNCENDQLFSNNCKKNQS